MTAYYNELDPHAAQWLRNLIAAGHIAPGDVDERDIRDVRADDLLGYRQCHFFAGVGVWSYALRCAGWPDNRPVWMASCPCQPFSAAGKGLGTADDRHLWPEVNRLLRECRPNVILGEQVASPDGLAWLDLVQADLEAAGYASGAVDLCAAGVGAPHIRQRLYWMANSVSAGLEGHPRHGDGGGRWAVQAGPVAEGGTSGGLADTTSERRHGQQVSVQPRESRQADPEAAGSGGFGGMGDPSSPAVGRNSGSISTEKTQEHGEGSALDGRQLNGPQPTGTELSAARHPGPVNGYWRDADWLLCRDGRWRAVEPGAFPLAHGIAGRVGKLRAYGNAIVAPVAAEFIKAVMEEIA